VVVEVLLLEQPVAELEEPVAVMVAVVDPEVLPQVLEPLEVVVTVLTVSSSSPTHRQVVEHQNGSPMLIRNTQLQ